MSAPRLLLLTDRSQLRLGRGLVRTVHECADAGLVHAGVVVVREHDLAPDERAALVAALRTVPGLRVLASRTDLPGAHGLHLSARGAAPGGARPWGRSCHDRADLVRAAAEGAAWATLSPWAATASKPGYGPPVARSAFADAPLPVLALGGVEPGSVQGAVAAGAHGVAVMGAVMRAAEPARVVEALVRELAHAVGQRAEQSVGEGVA